MPWPQGSHAVLLRLCSTLIWLAKEKELVVRATGHSAGIWAAATLVLCQPHKGEDRHGKYRKIHMGFHLVSWKSARSSILELVKMHYYLTLQKKD